MPVSDRIWEASLCERRKLRVNVGKSKVMRCARNEDGARLNVMLNGEALEEVDQFKYLGSVMAENGGLEADVHQRVNEGCKVLGALKGVMKNRGLGMNVKKAVYEKVVVPKVMYGLESWGMKVTERQKLYVFEMKCQRSMTGLSWLDRVRNEVVKARTGVRRELEARADMLFSFKNKYQYTYLNTYIALSFRTPKLPEKHTHNPWKQVSIPHQGSFPR